MSPARPGTVRARRDPGWTEQARRDAAFLFREHRARPLFGERLTQVLRSKPDFLAELDQLLFGELLGRVTGIAGLSLQLGRAREHALQCGAVESSGRTGRELANRPYRKLNRRAMRR